MALNEADTRAKLIDPALHARGWTEDLIRREETAGAVEPVDGKPRRRGRGRVDYTLRVKVSPAAQPLAVALLEAKAEHLPPTHGLEQAKAYGACRRLNVGIVFSCNGHLFVEFDRATGLTSAPRPLSGFPTPAALRARYETAMGFSLDVPLALPLLTRYAGGEEGARRYYQDAALRAVLEKLARGEKRALLSLATGAGKTRIAVNLLKRIADAGLLRRALFVCDRDELRNQGLGAFQNVFGADAAPVSGGNPQKNARILIATYQTLDVATDEATASFLTAHYPENYFSHIVIDECHRSAWGKWSQVLTRNPDAVQIGLTATPFTKGLGKWFDVVINVTTTRTLIEAGWLAPYRIFSCAEPDMTGVAVKTTGEWDETQASGKALEVVGDVVAEYLKHGENRKFICSAVDTVHVEELQRQFLAAGINVATYTYKDSEDDRADTTNEFKKPDSAIRGLITVTAASRGFDVPDVSCVIMARPLRKSLAEHIQLFGRGLRISPETGKKDCLVLDHSGNCARFFEECESFFDAGINELDDGKKRDKPKPKEKPEAEPVKCPDCRALHKPLPACPCCGHEYPKKIAVQHVPGTLKELIAGGYRKELSRDLWPQVAGYVLERREGEAARKQALAIFKDITGTWPLASWEQTNPVAPSTEVRNRIRSQQIRFAKRRPPSAGDAIGAAA